MAIIITFAMSILSGLVATSCFKDGRNGLAVVNLYVMVMNIVNVINFLHKGQ